MGEAINSGRTNMLEYVIVSAIFMHLEANVNNTHVSEVLKYYDNIMSFAAKYKILLAISSKTLLDLCKIMKQISIIRKTMN